MSNEELLGRYVMQQKTEAMMVHDMKAIMAQIEAVLGEHYTPNGGAASKMANRTIGLAKVSKIVQSVYAEGQAAERERCAMLVDAYEANARDMEGIMDRHGKAEARVAELEKVGAVAYYNSAILVYDMFLGLENSDPRVMKVVDELKRRAEIIDPGTLDPENLQTLCRSCNSKKGSK
jgi:hypothetical protein